MAEKIGNLADILEAAVRIERNGVDFYRKLYESSDVPAARDVFNFLAAEEEKHIGTFRGMLEKVADYNPRFSYPGEYEDYLQGIAWRAFEAFKKGFDLAGAGKSPAEAIGVAMDLETGSVAFYTELMNGFGSPEARQSIQGVINEEKSHLARLNALKTKLKF